MWKIHVKTALKTGFSSYFVEIVEKVEGQKSEILKTRRETPKNGEKLPQNDDRTSGRPDTSETLVKYGFLVKMASNNNNFSTNIPLIVNKL